MTCAYGGVLSDAGTDGTLDDVYLSEGWYNYGKNAGKRLEYF